ncbi:MAG: AAA domain-containing protein [Nitrososphaeraceae archaeon]|nr:AAA domain-containing protein [Nitrososphaeraceae archaeon]
MEMPGDELILTEEEKKLGISNVRRDGSVKSGFVIEFTINGLILRLATNNTTSTTFNRLSKALTKFQYPEDGINDLYQGLETTILRNFKWMIGEDIKNQKEGYTVNSETTLVETTSDDKIDADDRSTYTSVSIPEAIGMHSGRIQFEGVIGSAATDKLAFLEEARWRCYDCQELISKRIFNMLDIPNTPKKCPHCDSTIGFEHCHTYINSRLLKIQSEDTTNDTALELLPVYVLNEYTDNIQLSGRVKIYGRVAKRQDLHSKQFYTVIIAKFVEYKDKKKLKITANDEKEIIKYGKRKNLERNLTDQFAQTIIGEYFAKLTIILSAIGAPKILDSKIGRVIRRGRMHILIIGPPGGGKTVLAKHGGDLRPNSKFVSGTNTTGGSLTSMILSEDSKLTLRLGVAATTRDAFLVINEFDKLPDEHKNAILEVMEEGESILNKYAFLRKINAQTSVIATANPVNGDWINNLFVDDKELPFPLQILSRFDSIIIFRRNKTKEACDAFANANSQLQNSDNIESDYTFLQKYIEFARRIVDIRIDQDAIALLNNFYTKLMMDEDLGYDVSNRTFDTIYRIAKAFARLKLTNVVTKKIAQRAIAHIEEMLSKLNLTPSSKLDPSIYAFDKVTEYIQRKTHNRSDAINLVESIQNLCLRDEIMSDYLGDVFKRNINHKLDALCNKILKSHKNKLGISGVCPAIVYWRHQKGCKYDSCFERESGVCGVCDAENPVQKDKKNIFNKKWFDKVASNESKNKGIQNKVNLKKKKFNPQEAKK